MIDVDISRAVSQKGVLFSFKYSGRPELPDLVFIEPLELFAEYSVAEGEARFTGSFDTVLNVQCTRCLDDVAYNVEAGFDEAFTKSGVDDSYTYSGNTVSLDKMVYDYLMLSLPQKILCRDDCKGLCPVCGANRNFENCGCGADEVFSENNPFNKLKNLFEGREV